MPLRTSGEFSRVNYCVAKQLTPYVSLRVNKGGGAVDVECGVWMWIWIWTVGQAMFCLPCWIWLEKARLGVGIFSCRTGVPLTFQRDEGSR
jgi:hypothetical protein